MGRTLVIILSVLSVGVWARDINTREADSCGEHHSLSKSFYDCKCTGFFGRAGKKIERDCIMLRQNINRNFLDCKSMYNQYDPDMLLGDADPEWVDGMDQGPRSRTE